jgi:hypothetical protein
MLRNFGHFPCSYEDCCASALPLVGNGDSAILPPSFVMAATATLTKQVTLKRNPHVVVFLKQEASQEISEASQEILD